MMYLCISKETEEPINFINIITSVDLKKYELENPDIYLIPFDDLALPEEDLWE